MIYIATVHWKTDKWIDIQFKYLRNFIDGEFGVYAFLNDIDIDHSSRFCCSYTEPIENHAVKLNLLADKIQFVSEDENDILIFLDGDAFPIANLESFIYRYIEKHKLLAIQRKENDGDIQPHPSFCATTVGFWKKIRGDWNSGYTWKNPEGNRISDTGGNLLRILEEHNINWYPLVRTNKRNLHPLWFGIYDNLIYHHGAGFRGSLSRIDKRLYNASPNKIVDKLSNKSNDELKFLQKIIQKNNELSNKVHEMIVNNLHFYREFM